MLAWIHNPILTKFWRSQLRTNMVIPAVAGAAVLSMAFIGYDSEKALGYLVLLQMLIVLYGASRTAASVAQASETGMMDLHQITPMTSTALTNGFWLGPSALSWLLATALVPAMVSLIGFRVELLGYLLALVTCGLMWQAFGLMVGLYPKIKVGQAGSVVFIVGAVLWIFDQSFIPLLLYLSPYPVYQLLYNVCVDNLMYTHEPWKEFAELLVPMMILHHLILGTLFWTIARRRINSPQAALISKPMAVAVFVVVSLFTVIDMSMLSGSAAYAGCECEVHRKPNILNWYITLGMVQLLTGAFLGMALAVGRGIWMKGVQHMKHTTKVTSRYWSDSALNDAVVLCIGLLVLTSVLGISLVPRLYLNGAVFVCPHPEYARLLIAGLGVYCGILSISLLRQAIKLQNYPHSNALFNLMLFIIWVLPAMFVEQAKDCRGWLALYMISPIDHLLSVSEAVLTTSYMVIAIAVPVTMLLLSLVFMGMSMRHARAMD